MKRLALALALLPGVALGQTDPGKQFAEDIKAFLPLEEAAQGAVACGLRDSTWQNEAALVLAAQIIHIANQLWVPESPEQNAGMNLGMNEIGDATARGKAYTQENCQTFNVGANVGYLSQLDIMIKAFPGIEGLAQQGAGQ